MLHNYYSVVRVNDEHTTVVPGDSFNFEVKVLYHSEDTFPEGLQHLISPASITSQDFFQEGSNFLQSVLSLSPFTITCLEEVAEGVVCTVQDLFRVNSISAFLSLESEESQHRVIPLLVTVIVLNYEERVASEESRQSYRRSQRLSSRRRPTLLSSRRRPRQSSRVNQRQNSGVNHASEEDEVIINTCLKKCTVRRGHENCCICLEELNINAECYTMPCQHAFHLPCILTWLKTSHVCPLCRYSLSTASEESRQSLQSSRRNQRQPSRRIRRQSSRRIQRERESSRVNHMSEEAIINTFLKKCTVMRGSENCYICLEEFNINADCYTMPCEHVFHLPCILTWLKTSIACPLCAILYYQVQTSKNVTVR